MPNGEYPMGPGSIVPEPIEDARSPCAMGYPLAMGLVHGLCACDPTRHGGGGGGLRGRGSQQKFHTGDISGLLFIIFGCFRD